MNLFKKIVKFIILAFFYNGLIWVLIDGIHRVRFFDNFLKNTITLILALIMYELINFIRTKKQQQKR